MKFVAGKKLDLNSKSGFNSIFFSKKSAASATGIGDDCTPLCRHLHAYHRVIIQLLPFLNLTCNPIYRLSTKSGQSQQVFFPCFPTIQPPESLTHQNFSKDESINISRLLSLKISQFPIQMQDFEMRQFNDLFKLIRYVNLTFEFY